ncbi:MAG: ECF transporter S component [Ruminococcus sp.]|nr:ECF transporter S component [Ruminococcus sp.]
MNEKIKAKIIAMTGICAAVIFSVTCFLRIPVPLPGGAYINLGDSAIFTAAILTGAYPAAIAAAFGSALADLAAGAPVYIPATFIIKGVMGFLFAKITEKSVNFKTYIAAAVLCGTVMIIGYGIYESLVFSIPFAVSSLPFNLIQAAGSVAVSAVLYKPVLKIKVLM